MSTTKRKAITQLTPNSVDLDTEINTNYTGEDLSSFPRANEQELANRTFVVIKKGEPLPSDYFFDDSSDLVLDDNYAPVSIKTSHESPTEDSAPGDREDVVMGDNRTTTDFTVSSSDSKVSNTNVTEKVDEKTRDGEDSTQGVCSYTGTEVEQDSFWCSTCFPDDQTYGICEMCSKSCHSTHDVHHVPGFRNTFNCGCGSGSAQNPCNILSEEAKKAKAPKTNFNLGTNYAFSGQAKPSSVNFGIPKTDTSSGLQGSGNTSFGSQEKKAFSFSTGLSPKPFSLGSGDTKPIGGNFGAVFGKPSGDNKAPSFASFGENKTTGGETLLKLSGSFGTGDNKLNSGSGSGFSGKFVSGFSGSGSGFFGSGSVDKSQSTPDNTASVSNDKPKAVFGTPSGDLKQTFGSGNSTTPKPFPGLTSTLEKKPSLTSPGAFSAFTPSTAKFGTSNSENVKPFGSTSTSTFQTFGAVKATEDSKPFISNTSNISEGATATAVVGAEESAPILEKPTDLRTGEEDEDTIFEELSKIYRFTEGQWNIISRGKMKINKWKNENKYRMIFRSEGGLKLMFNAPIFKEMNPQTVEGNRVTFLASNLCTPQLESIAPFLVHFQSKEISEKFHSELTKSISNL